MINNKTHIETIVELLKKIAKKESKKVEKYNLHTEAVLVPIGDWENLDKSIFGLYINLENGEISTTNEDEFLNYDISSITLNDNWKIAIKNRQEQIKEGHNANYNEGVMAITELINFLYDEQNEKIE